MKQIFFLFLFVLAAQITNGCSESYIVIEIYSDLTPPDEVDKISIVTLDPENLEQILSDRHFDLAAKDHFPLQVLFVPSENTPKRLRQQITAEKSGSRVAFREGEHNWAEGQTSVAKFELEAVAIP